MKLNRTITGLVFACMVTANSVYAYDSYEEEYTQPADYYDYARVVDIKPLYTRVEVNVPRQECQDEERVEYDRHDDSLTPTIIGSILGGVVGSRFGGGKGKTVATVAGTLLGGSIARGIHKGNHQGGVYTHTGQRCRYVDDIREEERLDGYQVSYRYKGHVYTTRMAQKPGKRIKLHVALTPVN